MKPQFPIDVPAGHQHTPGYFCLQGSSPGFNPPVSSGLFDDPALADRRGTRMVGQNKASFRCPHRSAMRRGAEKAGKILPQATRTAVAVGRRYPTPLEADTRDAFPGRHDPLSALSCRGQSNGRRHCARCEAIDIECDGQSPGAEALGHPASLSHGYPCRAFAAHSAWNALALQIEQRVRQVNATLAEQDRRTLGMNPKGSHA
jgi:hypothetical protein